MKNILNREDALQAITNRESIVPLAKVWLPIEVTGEHRAMMDDTPVIEVIDEDAINSMVEEFYKDEADPDFPGILVDNDHLSHDLTQSTESKAWVRRLENRGGTLHGLLEWTDVGAEAIRNKRFKFFSSEYADPYIEDLGGGRVRPLKLTGLSLTNRPNHRKQKPITNRGTEVVAQPTQEETTMKNIATKLGLPETATEDEITAAIASLMERAAKADEMETETEVEEILNRHQTRIPDDASRQKWKDRLIKNRETAEEILADLPEIGKATEQATVTKPALTNRAKATVPDVSRANGPAAANDSVRAARITNRAASLRTVRGLSLNASYTEAEREIDQEDLAGKS